MYYNQLVLLKEGKVITANIEITDIPEGKITYCEEFPELKGKIVIPITTYSEVFENGWKIKE